MWYYYLLQGVMLCPICLQSLFSLLSFRHAAPQIFPCAPDFGPSHMPKIMFLSLMALLSSLPLARSLSSFKNNSASTFSRNHPTEGKLHYERITSFGGLCSQHSEWNENQAKISHQNRKKKKRLKIRGVKNDMEQRDPRTLLLEL